MSSTVEFCGEDLELADKVGMMPLMRLARVKQRIASKAEPTDADVSEVLVATLELIEQCLADTEWTRFEHLATVHRLGTAEIEAFLGEIMRAVAARPTGRSSDSSGGPQTIEPSSTDDSSSPATGPEAVIHRFNTQEHPRPDLALCVRKRMEAIQSPESLTA